VIEVKLHGFGFYPSLEIMGDETDDFYNSGPSQPKVP
jgi:hypothetical protein